RVLPARVLDAPAPPRDEAIGALVLRAVEARGALTEKGVADHFRLGAARDVRPRLEALVEAGRLRREPVDDGGPDVFLPSGAAPENAPAPKGAVLLSPFENLLWDRAFARRLFGFDHLIEVYKPAPQRTHGYYAMPLLIGDRIAARADLKADRAAGKLLVRQWTWEAPPSRGDEEAALGALERLARQLGIEAPGSLR
ncbi:MAG TPA: crosslink repair DNA glycosylase YcaQ family protein, partial [Candidatus Thermoplasmatota archaeon]|nr:crosslink repair DNA glycosylase YcaQ family protein [Candidatus Thermoplasmatota archaeon]